MNSNDVVGFTHSDGYALCNEHADYGEMLDANNESGKVQPIFAMDEWDSFPTCDHCNEPLEVSLTSDGLTYYLAMGEAGRQFLDDMGIYYDKRDCIMCDKEFYPQIGEGYNRAFCSEKCSDAYDMTIEE